MSVQSLSFPVLWETFRARVFRRRFVQDVSVLTIAHLAGAGLSFVQGIMVARWLGPELYGLAALVMAFPSLIHTFLDARSHEASVKFLSEFHSLGQREGVLAMCKLGYAVDLGIALLTFLVIIVAGPWAARTFVHDPHALGLMIIYAGAFFPSALGGTSYAVLLTLGHFPLIAWLAGLSNVLQFALVVGFVLMGWQVAGVVLGNAIASIFMGLIWAYIGWIFIHRTWDGSPFHGNWKALKGSGRQIFMFLAYNDLSVLLGVIPKQLDVLLLGYFRGPTEVSYYKLAKSLSGTVGYLVTPLQSVTYPKLAQLWAMHDGQEFRKIVWRLALVVGAPLGGVALLGIAFVPFLVPLLVGGAFRPAIIAAQLLLVGSGVWSVFFWLRPVYMAQGNMQRWLGISTWTVILSLAAYPVILPRWGYIGLSGLSLAIQVFGHGMALFWVRQRIMSERYNRGVFK